MHGTGQSRKERTGEISWLEQEFELKKHVHVERSVSRGSQDPLNTSVSPTTLSCEGANGSNASNHARRRQTERPARAEPPSGQPKLLLTLLLVSPRRRLSVSVLVATGPAALA